MDKAVPFIILEGDQFVLKPEARKVLTAIKGPVAIVSVAGVYRLAYLQLVVEFSGQGSPTCSTGYSTGKTALQLAQQ
jgi:hypothetical protein